MAYVVYNESTGDFIAQGRLSEQLDQSGLAEKEVADVYLTTVEWDTVTRDYVSVNPEQVSLTPLEFLTKFTLNERLALEALVETDPIVKDVFFLLDHSESIYLDNPLVLQGLGYFVQINALTEERMQEILGN